MVHNICVSDYVVLDLLNTNKTNELVLFKYWHENNYKWIGKQLAVSCWYMTLLILIRMTGMSE